jgi:hypothetical protein
MPTVEALEYERFDFSEEASKPVPLEDAVAKAVELRKQDPNNFHRVEPADLGGSLFRVVSVSPLDVYADFRSRISKSVARFNRRRF